MRTLINRFRNFTKSKWKILLAVVLVIVIVVGIFFLFKSDGTKKNSASEVLFLLSGKCCSDIGTTYIGEDDMLYFEDAESGASAYICDKVNCRHTKTPDCNAYIEGSERVFLYNGYVYIVARDIEGNVLTDFCIYREDMDGNNCRKILSFSGVQGLGGYRLCDGRLLMTYKNDFDYSDVNQPKPLEKSRCGIVLVDLNTAGLVEQKVEEGKYVIKGYAGEENTHLLLYDAEKQRDGIYVYSTAGHTIEEICSLDGIAIISDISNREFVWSDESSTYLYSYDGQKKQIADFPAAQIYIYQDKVYLTAYDRQQDSRLYYFYDLSTDRLQETGNGEAVLLGVANDRCYYATYTDGIEEDGFVSTEQYCKEGIQ